MGKLIFETKLNAIGIMKVSSVLKDPGLYSKYTFSTVNEYNRHVLFDNGMYASIESLGDFVNGGFIEPNTKIYIIDDVSTGWRRGNE